MHEYLKDGEYVNYLDNGEKADSITADDIHYEEGKTVDATEFAPVSYEAYCKSCLEPLGCLNKPVSTTTPTYKYMVGTLVYTTLDKEGNISKIEYADIVEDKDGLTVQKIESTYTDGEGWSTRTAEGLSVATFDTRFDCSTTKERALRLGSSLYLSKDSAGNWVVSKDNSSDSYKKAESDTIKIAFIENHNHLYGTSSAEADKATFVGNDSNFKLMSFLNNNLMDETNHYVYCEKCGLEYYPVAHIMDTSTGRTAEQQATCTKCNYYASNYCEVTVKKSNDPNAITAADAALTASKTAWKYGGAEGSAFTASTKSSDAVTQLVVVRNALKTADSVLEKMGIAVADSTARTSIAALLSTEGGATTATSIEKAIAEATAAGSAVLDGKETNYKTVLLVAEEALIGQKTTTDSTTVAGIAKAKKGSVVAEIKNWIDEEAVDVDSFVVKKGTVLKLDYDKYTTSGEVEYSFAENTGWLIDDSTKLQLTASGFKTLALVYYSISVAIVGLFFLVSSSRWMRTPLCNGWVR